MSELIEGMYEKLEELGSGGGGTVYLGRHVRLDTKIVLKSYKRRITARQDLVQREVDVLKNLSHQYIPHVYDYFSTGEGDQTTVYTVMEYIDGESLDKALKRGERFSQVEVIHWGKQLLQALDYLHSPTHGDPPRGYVHSDIKPANVMHRLNGDICLIDFNISYALGEEDAIGATDGYASPEHYGLDYSFSGTTRTKDETMLLSKDGSDPLPEQNPPKKVVPDVRSDIYSLGATLYHLLSGRKPKKDATKVIPLAENEASPQIAQIIAKAMQPNPDLRYQSAKEMLYALDHLRENDVRTKKFHRTVKVVACTLAALFVAGSLCSFTGMNQIRRAAQEAQHQAQLAEEAERQAKIAEQEAKEALEAVRNSEAAFQNGDIPSAKTWALQALAKETPYKAQGQKALTDALGVYDLADGFKPHTSISLPSQPIKMVVSPQGNTVAAIYAFELAIYNTESGEKIATLPVEQSALSDVVYADEDTVLYAGPGAIRAYSINNQTELWSGQAATRICCSEDGTRVAAVYKEETHATVYDVHSGEVISTVDFGGRSQRVNVNDQFVDPMDSLLCLNADGTFLGVSFADGSLSVFDTGDPDGTIDLMDPGDVIHYEGGFNNQYFAFTAQEENGTTTFAVIDTVELTMTGGFTLETPISIQADSSGVYIANENTLVKIHPVTGDQTEVGYTNAQITGFRVKGDYALVATTDQDWYVFGAGAVQLARTEEKYSMEYLDLQLPYLAVAGWNEPVIKLQKLETNEEADLFRYDPAYEHTETRLNAEKTTYMLFQYDRFRLYGQDGTILADVQIPDAEQVYDQQYRRDADGSRLEVTYNNGLIRAYSGDDGSVLWEKQEEAPDPSLYEEFTTDKYRITSPLHETPEVYDLETGEKVKDLEKDAYLSYVTQVGDCILTDYRATDGERFSLLLDSNLETIARLPDLYDVVDNTLIFDYPTGILRQSRIYSLQELLALAEQS